MKTEAPQFNHTARGIKARLPILNFASSSESIVAAIFASDSVHGPLGLCLTKCSRSSVGPQSTYHTALGTLSHPIVAFRKLPASLFQGPAKWEEIYFTHRPWSEDFASNPPSPLVDANRQLPVSLPLLIPPPDSPPPLEAKHSDPTVTFPPPDTTSAQSITSPANEGLQTDASPTPGGSSDTSNGLASSATTESKYVEAIPKKFPLTRTPSPVPSSHRNHRHP